jgi:uncharacterized protein (DUF983 family)
VSVGGRPTITTVALAKPVPKRSLFLRAMTLRCPQCGSRGLFQSWYRIAERCPTCGLRSDRVVGHWIGAVGVNTIVSFGALLVTLAVGFIVTYPDVPVVPMLVIALAVAVFVPLLFWPFSQTLWTAVDLAMRPAERSELDPRYEL